MDPGAVLAALKVVVELRKALDTAALNAKVESIQAALEIVGKRMVDEIFTDVDTGFAHLAAAWEAADGELRRDELRLARQHFARLANRRGGGEVSGTAHTFTVDQIRALGHVGNFYYFVLRDDPRLALLEAYRCTERFPVFAVLLLPSELFSHDYRAQAMSFHKRDMTLREGFRSELASHPRRRGEYRRKFAWKATQATGVFLVGVVGMLGHPLSVIHGAVKAKAILADSGDPIDQPSDALVRAHAATEAEVMKSVLTEARERRMLLESNPTTSV
jgi:hypothetical protein